MCAEIFYRVTRRMIRWSIAVYELNKTEPKLWVCSINLKREEWGEVLKLFLNFPRVEDRFVKYFRIKYQGFRAD